ncbi:MAG: glycosyltransferase [Deltaproteobacteria bacterium]|nr:glycosyltransferase [Deltaproteobacteria bacterium]
MKENFAILSHILPPSPSGQATVLYRLLHTLPTDAYCLISRQNYNGGMQSLHATAKLDVPYHYLKPAFQFPSLKVGKLNVISGLLNNLAGIMSRATQLKHILKRTQSTLLLACTGDLYDLPAAYLASRWIQIPYVVYIFDDYKYQWTGFSRSVSAFTEPVVLRHAKAIIVANEFMQNEYLKRYSLPSMVIHNPCSMPDLDILDRSDKLYKGKNINIVYTGSIYHAHFDAFRNLIAALNHIGRDDIKVHLFTAQSEYELRQHGISGPMIVHHEHIHETDVPKALRQADVLFLPLAFNSSIQEVVRTSAPGKTGEYLSVARPILVHAPQDTFLSWYFAQHSCGVVVNNNDPHILAKQLISLLENKKAQSTMSRNARKAAEQDFSLDLTSTLFTEIVKSMGAGYSACKF